MYSMTDAVAVRDCVTGNLGSLVTLYLSKLEFKCQDRIFDGGVAIFALANIPAYVRHLSEVVINKTIAQKQYHICQKIV